MIEYCESGMSRIPFKERDPKLYYYELRSVDEGNGYIIERTDKNLEEEDNEKTDM